MADATTAGTEQGLDAWDAEIDAITDRYTNEYRQYAERFGQAAYAMAEQVPGLSADVYIEADTDPNSRWWTTAVTNNATELDSDHVALEIWQTAHRATPLPNVDIWVGRRGQSLNLESPPGPLVPRTSL